MDRRHYATIISAASESVGQHLDELLQNTRNSFRPASSTPSRNTHPPRHTPRGRKRGNVFRRNVFLFKLAHADFLPTNVEQVHLSKRGMGRARASAIINRRWDIEMVKEYLLSLYPEVKEILRMAGFVIGRTTKRRLIIRLAELTNAEELERQIKKSMILLIPLRDMPNDLPLVRSIIAPEVSSEEVSSDDDFVLPVRGPSSRTPNATTTSARLGIPIHENPRSVALNEASTSRGTTSSLVSLQDFGLEANAGENGMINNAFTIPTLPEDAEIFYIELNRSTCVDDLLNIYSDLYVSQKKLSITFFGEIGVDGGGLTKEMFNLFFAGIENNFFKGEESIVPFLPLNRLRKEKDKFIAIGRALEHMILLTQNVPSKFSRVTLSSLGNPDRNIEEKVILEDFLMHVNPCERAILKKALNNFDDLHDKEQAILINIFSSHQFYDLPKGAEIEEQIITIATEVLIEKPKQFVEVMRQGISFEKYNVFWQECDFSVLLDMQKPTPDKICNCLRTSSDDLTNEQSTIMHYLEMYIRCLDNDSLRQFVFFITGSYQMPDAISVHFNSLAGVSRRPIVSTCANSIELSTNYSTYQDLKKELNSCLNSEDAYIYTTL